LPAISIAEAEAIAAHIRFIGALLNSRTSIPMLATITLHNVLWKRADS
jgi:hypothetical protein